VGLQPGLRALERGLDHGSHGVVDALRRLRAGALGGHGGGRFGQEGRGLAHPGYRTQIGIHAEAQHHVVREVGRLGQVVGGAGRGLAEHQLLGRAPGRQHCQAVEQFATALHMAVLRGALQRAAQRADVARDDRHLVHAVRARQGQRYPCVAQLVAGHQAPLGVGQQAVALSMLATMRAMANVKCSSPTAGASGLVAASAPR
jgi:hypothetical protein